MLIVQGGSLWHGCWLSGRCREEKVARRVVLIADAQGDDWGPMGPLLGALSEAGAMTELFTDCTAGLVSAVRGGGGAGVRHKAAGRAGARPFPMESVERVKRKNPGERRKTRWRRSSGSISAPRTPWWP